MARNVCAEVPIKSTVPAVALMVLEATLLIAPAIRSVPVLPTVIVPDPVIVTLLATEAGIPVMFG